MIRAEKLQNIGGGGGEKEMHTLLQCLEAVTEDITKSDNQGSQWEDVDFFFFGTLECEILI